MIPNKVLFTVFYS